MIAVVREFDDAKLLVPGARAVVTGNPQPRAKRRVLPGGIEIEVDLH